MTEPEIKVSPMTVLQERSISTDDMAAACSPFSLQRSDLRHGLCYYCTATSGFGHQAGRL